jgi:hypothetical protein
VSSGPVSLEGSLYNGDLLAASGGQTLGGPYSRFPTLASAGPMTMTFNNESTGTLVWPGGTVPIQRFNIVPNGLTAPPCRRRPRAAGGGTSRAGRGFFMEWQNGTLDIAGYMYDDNGNSGLVSHRGRDRRHAGRAHLHGTWWSYYRRADAHRRVAAEHAQQLERRADDHHLQRARRGDNDPT